MKYNQEKLENIYDFLKTNPKKGLCEQQVKEIQIEKGLNKFEEEKKETVIQRILHHLKEFTVIILLIAVVISFFSAIFDPDHGFTDPIIILLIVIINIILAIKQEMGAEKALEALKSLNTHTTVVIRDGAKQNVNAEDLVPGDILVLKAGNLIPADARIFESFDLKVEESALTGESVPVEKDANAIIEDNVPLGDQINMLFSGCLITNGKTRAVVTNTGMNTEMGKIAGMLNTAKKAKTPLQKKMSGLGRILCYVAIVSGLAMFMIQFFQMQFFPDDISLWDVLVNAVVLAVAVVPECLPVVVTVTMAYGVFNMAKKHAIIRKLPAVETLGSASVICSDKTGTLTMNQMTIKQVWALHHEPVKVENEFNQAEINLIEMMGLASNAAITITDGETEEIGDPTETAIVRLLLDKGINKKDLDAKFPKVFEVPFSSDRKLMTTVHELKDGRYMSITKGAFDRIPVDFETVSIESTQRIHDDFASNALRVISAGYKYYDKLPENLNSEELEKDLTFAGFVGMIDPPRPESVESVRIAKEAGIRTIMITGDHAATASAIAKEIGILADGDKSLTGMELNQMTVEELAKDVKNYSVYARVSPEDKIRIVQAWQAHGEIVAMTGDGVNDAPALKAADVGVAMGSGTDVSKNASDVILTDDNFASIVHAVAEGRRVYDNIRKVLYSLIACNISEIFTMLIAILLWRDAPLVAVQLLFINIVADGIPDLCMCREPIEKDAMKRKPISKNTSIFANGLAWRISLVAVIFAMASLIGYYVGRFVSIGGLEPSHEIGMTMAYVTVALSSVVNIFNVRSFTKSIFRIGFMSNKLLFFAIFFSLGLVCLTAALPGVQDIFHCVPVSLTHWLIMLGLSVSPLIIVEMQKFCINKWNKTINN